MKTSNMVVSGIAGAMLLALGSGVNAEERLVLTEADMDGVTAGAFYSEAGSYAEFSGWTGGAQTYSFTYADPEYTYGFAEGEAAGYYGSGYANAGSYSAFE